MQYVTKDSCTQALTVFFKNATEYSNIGLASKNCVITMAVTVGIETSLCLF